MRQLSCSSHDGRLHLNPGGDHSLDREERAPGAGDRDLQTPLDLLRGGVGAQRDLVHVDKMLAQRFEIDLRPVGLRVGVEDLHDLLDCAEGILTGIVGMVETPCISA